MKKIYNNTNNVFKSKLDEIKTDFHKFAQVQGTKWSYYSYELEYLVKNYHGDWIKFMKQMEKKVSGFLSNITPSHELYLQLNLIKTFCNIRVMFGLIIDEPQKFQRTAESIITKCEKKLKPIKDQAEGIWLYVLCQELRYVLIQRENFEKELSEPETKASYQNGLKMMEEMLENWKDLVDNKHIEPWGIDEIFYCVDSHGNPQKTKYAADFQKVHNESIKLLLLEFSIKSADEQKICKYAIEGVTYFLNCPQIQSNLDTLVHFARNAATALMNFYRFAQAQHIAAVVLHTITEFRRNLPEEQRSSMNEIQYVASSIYAELGNFLFRESNRHIKTDVFRNMRANIVQMTPENVFNTECVRLMPVSSILIQYEQQFPTEPTKDMQVLKRIQNKLRRWVERLKTLDTFDNPSISGIKERLPEFEEATKLFIDNYGASKLFYD